MKKGKLLAVVVGLVLVMGLVLVACDSGGSGGGSGVETDSSGNVILSGTTWKATETGVVYTLTFTSATAWTSTIVLVYNGEAGVENKGTGTYTVNKSTVTLIQSGGTQSATVSGNTMTIPNSPYGTLVLTKQSGSSSGSGGSSSSAQFAGKWLHSNGETSYTFTGNNFSTNGPVTGYNSSGTFTFTDTELTLKPTSGSDVGKTLVKGYTLSGNKLTIAQGNGGNYGTFTKQ